MSDSTEEKPTLGRKPLGLKRTVEAGQVQQSFSHGRKNTVQVEVKRRRILGRPGETAAPVEAVAPPVADQVAQPAPPPPPPPPPPPQRAPAPSLLSRQEMQT